MSAPVSRITKKIPLSVNYHFSRECNYSCKFCFHTGLNKDVLSIEQAKQGLLLLKDAGTEKVNFAGGEPLLPKHRNFLGEMIRYLKEELQIKSISIVSNGSFLKQEWFDQFGQFIDILAISCDSANEETNFKIGRASGKAKQVENLRKAKLLCSQHGIDFKINSVVNRYNWQEDMNWLIEEMQPRRWKVFQVLKLEGENSGEKALRNVDEFLITDEQFESFCERHQGQKSLVPESNASMKDSYLLLDEKMRFLNCSNGGKIPTGSILEIGVEKAMEEAGFDQHAFIERGGIYQWSRSLQDDASSSSCSSDSSSNLTDIEDIASSKSSCLVC